MPKEIIIKEVKNSGLVIEETNPKDYATDEAIGGIATPLEPPSIIFKDGHGHLAYQGKPEMQFNRKFDTYSCVLYTIAKALCYFLKERYDMDITISEMYNAYFAGVVQGRGTSIRNGMESFRLNGWVEDSVYPFTADTTPQQFYAKPPEIIIKDAKGKLTKWEFHWEVIGKDHASIIDAFKRTVVVLTGFAWASYYGEGVYFDYNNPANHAFLGVDYEANGNIKVDDSYPRDNRFDDDSTPDEFIKILDKSFKFGSAHRCFLTPIVDTKESLISKFINMITKFVRDIHGGFHLLKDNKRQKITSWWGLLALLGEILKPEQISDADLLKYQDVAGAVDETGKPLHFFPEN